MGTPIGTTFDEAPAERLPGQFARHPKTGAPWVASPTETSKHTGTKAELIVLCAERGIDWLSDLDIDPGKTPTVKQLQDLLGPRPRKVQYGRPSGLGKQIEDATNLQKWAERMEALGIGRDPALVEACVELATLGEESEEFRETADAIARRAKTVAQAHLAAERGTHHHELTELSDTDRDPVVMMAAGEDLGVPEAVQRALIAAWVKMLDTYDIEILATEATCVDDVWRQAGTLDRIARLRRDVRFITATGEIVVLPAGTILILDIKTGRLRINREGFVSYWHAYSVQLASYAQSVPYDPDTDTRGEWPWPIDQRWAIIAHLDILAALDGEAVCRLVLVDLEAGRHAGALCVAAREWEKRRDVFSIPTAELTVTVPVAAHTFDRPAQPNQEMQASISAAPGGPPPIDDFDQPKVAEPVVVTPALAGDDVGPPAQELPTPAPAGHPAEDDFDQPKPVGAAPAAGPTTDEREAAMRAENARRMAESPVTKMVEAARQQVAAVPTPQLPKHPDEGADLSGPDHGATWERLQAHFGNLQVDQKSWIGELIRQSLNHGVDFHARTRTLRRFELYRGLIALCVAGQDEDAAVRALAALALADEAPLFAAIPPGHSLGALDAAQAATFAQLVDAFLAGQLVPVEGDDGAVRLVAA